MLVGERIGRSGGEWNRVKVIYAIDCRVVAPCGVVIRMPSVSHVTRVAITGHFSSFLKSQGVDSELGNVGSWHRLAPAYPYSL